jgi:hypothetical protein
VEAVVENRQVTATRLKIALGEELRHHHTGVSGTGGQLDLPVVVERPARPPDFLGVKAGNAKEYGGEQGDSM